MTSRRMPSDKSIRAIKSLAAKRGLVFDKAESTLAGRKLKIQVLYKGGSLIMRLLDGTEIAAVQLGCGGEWACIIPLETLLSLLEADSLKTVAGSIGPENSQNI